MEPRDSAIYPVWRIRREYLETENGRDCERETLIISDQEIIKVLPKKLKILIAYYSKYIPEIVWNNSAGEDKNIALILGGYETLEEAQNDLLLENRHLTENRELIIVPAENYPLNFDIKKTGRMIYAEYLGNLDRKRRTDEFRAGEEESIEFLRRI
jgi:hypothetical protein